MSGMTVMAGGPTAKENREVREGGSEPRAHLLEQLAGDSESFLVIAPLHGIKYCQHGWSRCCRRPAGDGRQ